MNGAGALPAEHSLRSSGGKDREGLPHVAEYRCSRTQAAISRLSPSDPVCGSCQPREPRFVPIDERRGQARNRTRASDYNHSSFLSRSVQLGDASDELACVSEIEIV